MKNAAKVTTIISQILDQDSKDDNEKRWMQQNAPSEAVAAMIHRLATRDFHIIIAIYREQRAYAKQLPKVVHISQPTVSRAIKKLAEIGLINRYSTPQNNKDIIVELTSMGMEIAKVQMQLRAKINLDVEHILADLSPREAEQFVTTLQKIRDMNIFD